MSQLRMSRSRSASITPLGDLNQRGVHPLAHGLFIEKRTVR